jgi:pyridoxamine 5'-phosphate oxidase
VLSDQKDKFFGDDPFAIARRWLKEAEPKEPNDPNAAALATVDAEGMPNVRIVLLKEIEDEGFVFYTNYDSAKGRELQSAGKAAMVLHWKSLRRQVRVRGLVEKVEAGRSDEYYASRALGSRIGAWASHQSQPLASKAELLGRVARLTVELGLHPARPPFWGGFRIRPVEFEFWADGEFRLHDRFRWTRKTLDDPWQVTRLNP